MSTFPLVAAFLIFTVALCGALMAATPYLMPKRECFAVTVPESAHRDPEIRTLKRSYVRWVALLTAVCTVAAAVGCILWAPQSASSDAQAALMWMIVVTTAAVVIVPFGFMLHFRKKVMGIKKARGWAAQARESVAFVGEEDTPHAISLAWNLLYIPVALIVVAIGAVAWPTIPDMVPMHADFNGNVTRYEPKSFGVVFGFPLLVIAFLALAMVFSHWFMARSKRPTDPGAPATSALAYGLFARAESIFLVSTGIILSAGIGITFMLSTIGVMSLGGAGAVIVVLCIPIVGGAIALSVIYGQAGSRLFKRMGGETFSCEDVMPQDDDEHWKLGIFYFNKDDASLWLPERFGIGWTMNFAKPAAWAIIAGLAIATIVFIVACFALVG